MTTKIAKIFAQVVSILFHPFAITTYGASLIYFSLPGYEFYTQRLTNIFLGIVVVSTFILPATFVLLMAATKNIGRNLMHHRDRMLPFIFSAFSIYLGAQLIGKLPLPGIFRLFMLASCLLLIILFVITTKWKISGHMAAIGGITALLISVTLRFGTNFLPFIIASIAVSGLLGTSRIYLNKHLPSQVYAGFFTGFTVIFATVYYF